MARDGGQRDGERGGKLVDRAAAAGKPHEDRPARRIGKRGESVVEGVHHLTELLINTDVKYRKRGAASSPSPCSPGTGSKGRGEALEQKLRVLGVFVVQPSFWWGDAEGGLR